MAILLKLRRSRSRNRHFADRVAWPNPAISCARGSWHASRDEIGLLVSPSDNTPMRNYNVTEHARVEEGEGEVAHNQHS